MSTFSTMTLLVFVAFLGCADVSDKPTTLPRHLDPQTLTEDGRIFGVPLVAGTRVWLDSARHDLIALIPSDAVVQGIPCRAGAISFVMPSGELRAFTLSADFVIDSLQCFAGDSVEIHHKVLVRLRLAKGRTIHTVYCHAGSVVDFFDGNRRRMMLTPDYDTTVQGIPVMGGKRIVLSLDYAFSMGTLSRDFEYRGIVFRKGTNLLLGPDGSIEGGTLARDCLIDGTPYRAGQKVADITP